MQPQVSELLMEAANLLLVGMVVVFAFLSLLIVATRALSYVVSRYFPAEPVAPEFVQSPQSVSPELVAAIAAAVDRYRNK